MQIGENVHGFIVKRRTEIAEIGATAWEFAHGHTGAKLLFLQCDDDNKVFSISFRTPPHDDTGVAHIVEHSVLCGSHKFPLKEPFVELVKGSLNTFLNAITFPDKTMYPIASRNAQDFHNLMDVYLDAVFHPLMIDKPTVLMQEGWHYEQADDGALTYSGVVYNEMKGALSSPEGILETEAVKALLPDTIYAYESGGDPEHIPELTQAKFIDFHRRYYHPSNAYLWLYGDLDIEATLAFLDGEYLSKYTQHAVHSQIGRQEPFGELRRLVKPYPLGADEDERDKAFLLWQVVLGDHDDNLSATTMTVLEHMLLETEAAPLKQAIVKAGIGKDVSGNVDLQMRQRTMSVEVAGANPEDADRFYGLCQSTLRRLLADGLDRTLLEASINYLEFRTREKDFGTTPTGLIYNIAAMAYWLYGGDPVLGLAYEANLRQLRDGLDNGLYERMLRRWLLDNPHQLLLTLTPSRTMAADRDRRLRAQLAAAKARMSAPQLSQVVAQTRLLKEIQQREDSPEALATIPLLRRADIRTALEPLPLEVQRRGDRTLLFTPTDTHGIAYLTLYFDLRTLTRDELLCAHLLMSLLGAVDTARHSYSELATLETLHTGGITYDISAYNLQSAAKSAVPAPYVAKAVVRLRTLSRNLPQSIALLTEILARTTFDDRARIREIIEQDIAFMERNIQNAPNQLMMRELTARLTLADAFNELAGLPYYRFIKALRADYAARFEPLRETLRSVMRKIFTRCEMVPSLTLSAGEFDLAGRELESLYTELPSRPLVGAVPPFSLATGNLGLLTASQVQYVGQGGNFLRLGYEYTGAMHVLRTILSYGYLWTQLRVLGGAYGAAAQFGIDGTLTVSSYRDPRLDETLAAFGNLGSWLRKFEATPREMTKYVIGAASAVDMPLTPRMRGERVAGYWLRGIKLEQRRRAREQMLSADVADIRRLGDLVDACMGQRTFCVLGNEDRLRAAAARFDDLLTVLE